MLDHALAALPRADAVVLSDYAKGVLTNDLIRQVIEARRAAGKPVIVDPKGTRLQHLSRRDAGDAQPQGIGRSRASRRLERCRCRGGRSAICARRCTAKRCW